MGPAGPIAEPVEMAYQSLTAMGLLGARAVRVIAANWIDCAYVHFLADTAQRVTLIRERLEEHNIFTVGRYGRWDYISMEDSLIDGVSLAKGLIGTV
jgi:protoporphyrinogen oxidase